MITLDDLKKFLEWANMGLYHKNNPLTRLEVQNDAPHYRINEINEQELMELVQKFNLDKNETLIERVRNESRHQ